MKITTKAKEHENNGQDGEIDRIYIEQDGVEYMIEPKDKGRLRINVFGINNTMLIELNSYNSIIINGNPR